MRKTILTVFLSTLCAVLSVWSVTAQAELTRLSLEAVTDSEEPFSRRLYSYDFDVAADGTLHAVYSKPVVGENRAQIVYMSKQVGAAWPAEAQRTVLEEFGIQSSISTWVMVDSTGVAHVSYLVERDFTDADGIEHAQGLVHQTIENGTAGEKNNVASGGFHTRMQLTADNQAVFAREYEVFVIDNDDGSFTFLDPPFSKALRILYPKAEGGWTDREHILALPTEEDYRLVQFVYDASRDRYHVAYGNKNATTLRDTYPTVNPPIDGKNPVFFPPGSGHILKHAFSDDLTSQAAAGGKATWTTSTIDASGNISENEFWMDLLIHPNGTPYAANYRYKTNAQGVHQGSSNVIGRFVNGSWHLVTVAGASTGASEHRAGMGPKIVIDAAGGFHAMWDNSPDKPIDSEGGPETSLGLGAGGGTTMYRYSPDGIHWNTRQVALNFSVESHCRLKIHDNKLLFMVLGDARNAKLYYAEYQLPAPTAPLFEIASDKMFYGANESIRLHARLQGDGSSNADLYVAVAGPYNHDVNTGTLTPVSTTGLFFLNPNFQWQTYTPDTIQPLVSNLPLSNLSLFIDSLVPVTAKASVPFNNPARYRLYSIANEAGQPLFSAPLTSLYQYDLHVCNLANCGEL